ncbi:MAG: S-(hydroxymethyl)glutathione dehydrogenase / alcohol dehydrogenase [Gaiellaceae bacterium]|jgi:S-(hydroxymethyl)glutathione dehydrogenase/alcohol dehydrogenase|nr:S-(hydroxymethyl)glutathione dehydrogenase / alcohol dehydrogenase [Gaiellaceae bacterium]
MKTRAALFHGTGRPLEVRELDLDEPRGGEVLVRMAAVGICGTDLHVVKGDWQRPTPMVLGHEGAGVVEAVGPGVAHLAEGDRVVLSWAPSCGKCADCRRGSPAACLSLQRAIGAGTLPDGTTGMSLDGETVYRGTATGALSERLVVAEGSALPLGDDVPLEQAALLGCAALTGVGAAIFAADVRPGSSALVVGAGGVGQFVVQGARIAQAERIVAVDPVEARREACLQLGATDAFAPEELADALPGLAPDGVDYSFDAVGHPETTALALRWTRNGGHCMVVGLPAAGERLDLDPGEFVRREKHLTGTMYGSIDPAEALPVLLEHVREGRLELASMVGPSFPLDEVNDAFDASLAGAPGRVLVTP